MVKYLPARREIWVQPLDWEDPLEEGMATHFRILAWRIAMDRGAWRATVHGLQRVGHDWTTKHSTVSLLLLAKLRLLAKIWSSMSRAIRNEECIYSAKYYCIRLFSLLLAHGISMTTIWNRYDYSYFCKGIQKFPETHTLVNLFPKVIRMWSLDKTSVPGAKARRR